MPLVFAGDASAPCAPAFDLAAMRRWLAMENGPIGTPQHARQRQRSKVGEERRCGTRRDSIEARGGRRRFRRFALISMQTTAAVSHRLASLLLVRATDAALLQDTPAGAYCKRKTGRFLMVFPYPGGPQKYFASRREGAWPICAWANPQGRM
jgi:hypothetical protein